MNKKQLLVLISLVLVLAFSFSAVQAQVNNQLVAPKVTATVNGNAITVSWVPVIGATGYRVYFRPATSRNWTSQYDSPELTASVANLQAGTYEYAIQAYSESNGVKYLSPTWGQAEAVVRGNTVPIIGGGAQPQPVPVIGGGAQPPSVPQIQPQPQNPVVPVIGGGTNACNDPHNVAAPQVTMQINGTSATFSWYPVVCASGYIVAYGKNGLRDYTERYEQAQTSRTFNGIERGITQTFVVQPYQYVNGQMIKSNNYYTTTFVVN